MSDPVFSIITPTFRRPLLLKRNIISVRNQTFENYEQIIIDDADDKETERIVAGFNDERIIFLRHESGKGAAASYNTGIKASRGKFIVFLDDDDEYLPISLEKMHKRISQSGPDIGFIISGFSKVRDKGNGEEIVSSTIWPDHFSEKGEGLVAATSIGNGYGVCIKRECIDEIGLYDETIISGQDTDFLFRLAQNFDFGTIPEVLVKIHQHDYPQLTSDQNYLIRIESREKIIDRYGDFIKQFPALYYTHYKSYADLCYNYKLRQKGRKAMFAIIKNSSFRLLNFTDLFLYEITGKDTFTNCSKGIPRRIVRHLKNYFNLITGRK